MPDDDKKTERIYRLSTDDAAHGYTDEGKCIECEVIGEDLCSIHGEHDVKGKEKPE